MTRATLAPVSTPGLPLALALALALGLLSSGAAGGALTPPGFAPEANPNAALLRAARNGDVRRLRKVVLETPSRWLDLDAALSTAASRARLPAMNFLVDLGATDLDRALVSAARWDHCGAVRWLISPDRAAPATALEAAQHAAGAMGSCNAEWLLLSVRCREEQ